MKQEGSLQGIEGAATTEYLLPRVIDTPYPHVASGDLFEILRIVDPSIAIKDTAGLQHKMFSIQRRYMPEGSTFYSYTIGSLDKKVEEKLKKYKESSDKKVGFAILDRSIGSQFDPEDVFRLQISRGNNNDIVARSRNAQHPDLQIDQLTEWVTTNNIDDLQVVDDILAFGQTLVPVSQGIKQRLPDISLGIQVGIATSGGIWRGYEVIEETSQITPEYVTLAHASPATPRTLGMSIPTSKGMTIFGGYRESNASIERPISIPHIIPFTIPKTAFFDINKRLEASTELLNFSQELVSFIEDRKTSPLLVGDLISMGFGIPYTTIDEIKGKLTFPKLTTSMGDYLLQVQDVFFANQGILHAEMEKANETERKKFVVI